MRCNGCLYPSRSRASRSGLDAEGPQPDFQRHGAPDVAVSCEAITHLGGKTLQGLMEEVAIGHVLGERGLPALRLRGAFGDDGPIVAAVGTLGERAAEP